MRVGERAVVELLLPRGGVLGRMGEDDEPGNGDEKRGGGNDSRSDLDGSEDSVFDEDGCARHALAKTRV